jgi:hypothetical protein
MSKSDGGGRPIRESHYINHIASYSLRFLSQLHQLTYKVVTVLQTYINLASDQTGVFDTKRGRRRVKRSVQFLAFFAQWVYLTLTIQQIKDAACTLLRFLSVRDILESSTKSKQGK